jgi:3-dehydroquinate synthetase
LLHGEAIALGMKYEIGLALLKKLISPKTATSYLNLIQKFFHHLTTEPLPADLIYNIMQHDKKNNTETISFVLPLENGKFVLDVGINYKETTNVFS